MRSSFEHLVSAAMVVGLLVLASGALTAGPARAANYALLVGATDYPNENDVLEGPINDVEILARALGDRGFSAEDIRVLVDRDLPEDLQVERVGRPTKARIMGELQRLAEITGPGDFVYIHLSGHGSQQPQPPGIAVTERESDFMDEIFLPVDIGTWSDPDSTVENAIVDHELGDLVRRMRANGAFVWLVVDSCHSGRMTRDAERQVPEDAQARVVDPHSLGIPGELLARAFLQAQESRTRSLRPPTPEPAIEVGDAPSESEAGGGLVVFFAAQEEELALEMRLPQEYSAPDRRQLSLLTFHLVQALNTRPGATYREIALAIQAGYDRRWGASPTPQFEGDLDRPVFLGEGAASPRWSVDRQGDGTVILAAGRLHGIVEGARIGLYSIESESDRPLAEAEAVAVGVSQTVLRFAAGAAPDLPDRIYGIMHHRPVAEPITLSLPPVADDAGDDALAAALELLQRNFEAEGRAVEVVPAGETADINLRLGEEVLALIEAGAADDRCLPPFAPSVSLDQPAETIAQAVRERVASIARARDILAVAAEHGSGADRPSLSIELLVTRDSTTAANEPPHRHACPPPPEGIPVEAAPLRMSQTSTLRHCDTLFLQLENEGDWPIDASLLYLGHTGEIRPMPPFENGLRVEPGEVVQVPVQVATWHWIAGHPMSAGLDRLVVIGVERGEGADLSFVVSFDHLADPVRVRTRSLAAEGDQAASAVTDLIEGLSFPGRGATRSLGNQSALFERVVMQVVRWRSVTEEEEGDSEETALSDEYCRSTDRHASLP